MIKVKYPPIQIIRYKLHTPPDYEITSFYKFKLDDWIAPQLGRVDDDEDKGKYCDELKIINGSLKVCTMKVREKNF